MEKNKIEEFLETNKKSHFLQSPEWARVKSNWKHEMIVIDENGEIKGTMSLLLRKVPIFNRYIMYAPRGFVCDEYDKETLKKLTEKARKIANKYHVFIFRLDPDIPNDDEEFKSIMKELGYMTKENIQTINQVIQPKYVFRLNILGKTEEELLQSFSQKTRYNIRLAKRKGVTTRIGKKDDLKVFYNILKETSLRDNFFIRPLEYYERIYKCMGEKHVRIIIAEYEGIPIAASMPILYGNKVWYLYGGSSNKYRNLMPNYLLQFEMMKWGIENKCDIYDFRGISGYKNENDLQYGVYRFKKGFNPEFIEFIDELYIVFNPTINYIFNMCNNIYMKLKK